MSDPPPEHEARLHALELLIANLYALDQARMGGRGDLRQALDRLTGPDVADEVSAHIERVLALVRPRFEAHLGQTASGHRLPSLGACYPPLEHQGRLRERLRRIVQNLASEDVNARAQVFGNGRSILRHVLRDVGNLGNGARQLAS